jgi:hypothetical protein
MSCEIADAPAPILGCPHLYAIFPPKLACLNFRPPRIDIIHEKMHHKIVGMRLPTEALK